MWPPPPTWSAAGREPTAIADGSGELPSTVHRWLMPGLALLGMDGGPVGECAVVALDQDAVCWALNEWDPMVPVPPISIGRQPSCSAY